MQSKLYWFPFLRLLGWLTLALIFPLAVIGVIETFFVGKNIVGKYATEVAVGIGIGEALLLGLAFVQGKRAWIQVREHSHPKILAVLLFASALIVLAGVAAAILLNIKTSCGCE